MITVYRRLALFYRRLGKYWLPNYRKFCLPCYEKFSFPTFGKKSLPNSGKIILPPTDNEEWNNEEHLNNKHTFIFQYLGFSEEYNRYIGVLIKHEMLDW